MAFHEINQLPNLRQKVGSALKAYLHLSKGQLQFQQMKANQKSRQFFGGVLYQFPHVILEECYINSPMSPLSVCFGLCLYTVKVVL